MLVGNHLMLDNVGNGHFSWHVCRALFRTMTAYFEIDPLLPWWSLSLEFSGSLKNAHRNTFYGLSSIGKGSSYPVSFSSLCLVLLTHETRSNVCLDILLHLGWEIAFSSVVQHNKAPHLPRMACPFIAMCLFQHLFPQASTSRHEDRPPLV